jgi:hypothetical protein
VNEPANPSEEQRRAGLCASCVNARRISSDRGSIFVLCELSPVDPSFTKYPRLPVFTCSGYQVTPNEPPERPS